MASMMELAKREPESFFELRDLIKKVDKANPENNDGTALAVFLNLHPEFWRVSGDLAEQASLNMIQAMNAPRAMKESLKAGLDVMENELSAPTDGELERLIIRQAVGCWLRLSYIEYSYGRSLIESNQTLTQASFWERRLSAAQRRYLRALETLSRVRRLNLPAVEVNIASQQVNQVNQQG